MRGRNYFNIFLKTIFDAIMFYYRKHDENQAFGN